MKHSGTLASSLPKSRPEPRSPEQEREDEARLARRVWRDRGVVLLRPDEVGNEWRRRAIESLATELYGPRRNKKTEGK